jgi:HEAT repeat protein
MSEFLDVVERFKIPGERHRAMAEFSEGVGARQTRGKKLSSEKISALIWGLSHTNASVRRCCLELLDAHPSEEAVPHIVARLDDPVPRVRWHAVHAIRCDVCKAGSSFLTPELMERLREIAANDPSPRVRREAAVGLAEVPTGD